MKKIITKKDIKNANRIERIQMFLAIIKGQAIYLSL